MGEVVFMNKTNEKNNQTLLALAEDLAKNYSHISFSEDFNHHDEILITPPKPNEETRNILILGAGASHGSYSFLPLGIAAIEKIEKSLKFDELLEVPSIKEQYLHLAFKSTQLEYKDKNQINDFETRLQLLSHFYHFSTLRKAVQEVTNFRTFPTLTYEVIAHMFKNRFFDIIINFNFDELLDQAIEEEIGNGKMIKIVSDGDCISYDEMLIDERLKTPVYIKPHGTASHRSSLRFTKEHYFDIPSGIKEFIEDLFEWREVGNKKFNKQSLNLIAIGFAMNSVEFNNIISKTLIKKKDFIEEGQFQIRTYYFDWSNKPYKFEIESEGDRDKYEITSERDVDIRQELASRILQSNVKDDEKINSQKGLKFNCIHINNKNSNQSLSEVLLRLYHYIEAQFITHDPLKRDPTTERQSLRTDRNPEPRISNPQYNIYSPRGLWRHRMVCELFEEEIKNASKDIDNTSPHVLFFQSPEYYLQRTILELIISCFKNKGKIQLKELLDDKDRVWIYYKYYLESHKKQNSDLTPSQLDRICRQLKLDNNKLSITRNIYSVPLEDHEMNNFNSMKSHFLDLPKYLNPEDSILDRSISKVLMNLNEQFQKHPECLESIFHSDVVDVYPNYTDGHLYIFDNYTPENVLSTDLALEYKFYEPFYNEEWKNKWKILLTVAERGKYLLNERNSIEQWAKEGKRIELIVSESFYAKEWEQNPTWRKLLLNEKFGLLPYYTHNQHMGIFLDIVEGKPKVRRAIYYYKKGYSNKINPICFDCPTDERDQKFDANFDHLLELFFAYKLKSDSFKNQKHSGTPSIRHIINEEDVEIKKQLDDLVNRYNNSLTN